VYVLASSSEFISIPVSGPTGVNLANATVSIALVSVLTGGEPATADYKSAQWLNGEAARQFTPNAGTEYAPGEYTAFVRVVNAPEDVRLASGRVRIGDARA
jgi:hypothetical protein